jgi:hypothetical protein
VRVKRGQDQEPEIRIGNCCGCQTYPVLLFKVPGIYRYRCDECYAAEVGHRHHMAPAKEPARIVLP